MRSPLLLFTATPDPPPPEIELDAEDETLPEPPGEVLVLREVTDDNRFVSGRLARLSPKKQRKLVKKAYKEVKGWKGLA